VQGKYYIFQGAIFGKEAANGLAIHLAGGEVNETLVILTAELHHRQGIHKVAVDGVQWPRVVIGWRANGCQVDHLK